MQQLKDTSKPAEEDIASLVIETILQGMRLIRSEMRAVRPANLTVPQFRTLLFVSKHCGASLSELADHLELALPSVSRAVDYLVKHGLVVRETSPEDRRRITLRLTDSGVSILQAAKEATRARMAKALSLLTTRQRLQVVRGISALRKALGTDKECALNIRRHE